MLGHTIIQDEILGENYSVQKRKSTHEYTIEMHLTRNSIRPNPLTCYLIKVYDRQNFSTKVIKTRTKQHKHRKNIVNLKTK